MMSKWDKRMLEQFQDFFRSLAENHPTWNFIFFYQERQWDKVVSGVWMTVQLSVVCVVLSVAIGMAGAAMQRSRFRVLRVLVEAYIQFFRNTPPFVQLLFFYFALGSFTPTYSPDGWLEVPIISNVGWAIISLSFFAGAFNVEIFRAGIETVPDSTQEASEALGFTSFQTFIYVVLPLAVRASMPALNTNLVNLVKTTTQAFVIAVPELLYQSVTIWNDYPSAQNPMMLVMFLIYLGLVGILVAGMNRWERAVRIPGFGG